MDNSQVRAFLRKGELATTTLEALGYTFKADPENTNRLIWIAPEKTPEDAVAETLRKLIKDETAKAYLAGERHAREETVKGPNWNLVCSNIGKAFKVRVQNIPSDHPLSNYNAAGHFIGRAFKCISIQYENTEIFKGYTVSFEFNTRPYTPQVVRLPISACAFQS